MEATAWAIVLYELWSNRSREPMLPAVDEEITLPAGLCTARVVPGKSDRDGS